MAAERQRWSHAPRARRAIPIGPSQQAIARDLLQQQQGILKLATFTPQQLSFLMTLERFSEAHSPRVNAAPLFAAPWLSFPSGTQASKFPAKELELTSKGFAVNNLSIS